MLGLLDRIVASVSSFVDSGICAFASACGDAFEDFSDGVRSALFRVSGGNPA
jgi:hypothetical protein